MKPSLRGACLESVRRRGEATISEVMSDVGHLIDSARAAAHGHARARYRKRVKPAVDVEAEGRRGLVNHALRHLIKDGKIERVAPGRYRWRLSLRLIRPA